MTDEELLLVRGGTDKKKYNSVGEIIRRTNLKYAQDVVREAAIYRPHAKGNFDYEGAAEDVTWCNQSSYDVMEATGVHMEAFYGEPDGYKEKKVKEEQDIGLMQIQPVKMLKIILLTMQKNKPMPE